MIIAKTVIISGTAGLTVMAVIDPGITSMISAAISAIVALATIVFGYKTALLAKEIKAQNSKIEDQGVVIKEVKDQSDGMKDALVKATEKASHAEGMMAGIDKAEAKVAIVVAKADALEHVAKEKTLQKVVDAVVPPGDNKSGA